MAKIALVLSTLEGRQLGYLASYDADSDGGRGRCTVTLNPAEAMSFENMTQAMEVWRTQSKVRPLREDGKPNRPLTAFTVELVQVPA